MSDDVRTPLRPRRLTWLTLTLAVATAGLALRWLSPALNPADVPHVPAWFDVAFGGIGGGGLAWAAMRLWRHFRRDSAAAVFALSGWTLLMVGLALRLALFAQADYERGRSALFVAAGMLALITVAVWWKYRNRAAATHTEYTKNAAI